MRSVAHVMGLSPAVSVIATVLAAGLRVVAAVLGRGRRPRVVRLRVPSLGATIWLARGHWVPAVWQRSWRLWCVGGGDGIGRERGWWVGRGLGLAGGKTESGGVWARHLGAGGAWAVPGGVMT